MRAYVLSIVSAALICAVARCFLGNKTAIGRIAGVVTSVLMLTAAVSPLRNINFYGISEYINGLSYDARSYVEEGMAIGEKEREAFIKSQTEAYILDKANQMGLVLSVEVELDERNGNCPSGVVVTGNLSPYAKEVLGSYIWDTLGIAKENQRWD